MNQFFITFALVVYYAVSPAAVGPHVLLVGDSNVGTGLVAGLTRQGSLQLAPWELTPVSVSGSGLHHQGFWVPHLRSRVRRLLQPAPMGEPTAPPLIVFNLGINDACDWDFGAYWTELPNYALNLLREVPTSVPVVVIGLPTDQHCTDGRHPEGGIGWLNQFAWPYALQEWGGRYRMVIPPTGLLGDDGVHYSDPGGRVVADVVYGVAGELLGETQP